MRYILVKFNDNWADEMDIDGFKVMTEERHKKALASLDGPETFPFEAYFGTNESNLYEDKDQFLRNFEFIPVDESFALELKQHFPYGFGSVPWPE